MHSQREYTLVVQTVGISIIIISSVRRLTAHALGLRASYYTKRLNFLSFNNDPTRSFCVEEGGGRDRPIYP